MQLSSDMVASPSPPSSVFMRTALDIPRGMLISIGKPLCTQVILDDVCVIFKGEVYDISNKKTGFATGSEAVVVGAVSDMIGGGSGSAPRTGQ